MNTKMYNKSEIILLFGCILCFLAYIYGIVFKIIYTEENECEMTYMFEVPFFERINFPNNANFSKYGLYAYTEGALVHKVRAKIFDGLPVIFIPGNGGSYKQVRSFASVALRKSIDLKWKKELNYFTVDLNEEFSGIYGGYLNDQKQFIKLCILAVLNLYNKTHLNRNMSNVILIGHSMGGKIAQSLLTDDDNNHDVLKHIHTIITLATPLDRSVINIDSNLNSFYEKINNFLSQSKRRNLSNLRKNTTINHCLNSKLSVIETSSDNVCDDNLMVISIGGGNRDYMVHDGLSLSKYSEINVLTTHIPNVWTSTDHLCAVWCLQLARVMNRFLFDLIQEYPIPRQQTTNKNSNRKKLNFIQSKVEKLNIAEHYFLNPTGIWGVRQNIIPNLSPEHIDRLENLKRNLIDNLPKNRFDNELKDQMIRLRNDIYESPRNLLTKEKIVPTLFPEYTDWFENSKRNFIEYFPNGLNKIRVQMIRLQNDVQHDMLTVKTMNIDVNNWIFGCSATQVTKTNRFCGELYGLDYIMETIPSFMEQQHHQLHFQKINLAEIRKQYPNWTHILLYIRPSSKKMKLYVNIHRHEDHSFSVRTPYWFEYHKKVQHFKIPFGLYHRIFLPDVFNVYQVLNITVIPINCSTSKYPTLIKLCVPWMKGCNRYRFLRNTNDFSLLVYPSIPKPVNYNNSNTSMIIDLHFDSKCSHNMRYEVVFGGMLSQIIHQNFHRLPSYILAVLILIFQQQISYKSNKILLSDEPKIGTLLSFIVSMKYCFLMIGLLIITEYFGLSSDDTTQSNIFIDLTLCGFAYTIVLICFTLLWLNTIILRKFLRIILHLISKRKHLLPILSVIFVLIASISCGGLALCFACIIYFVLIVKKYDLIYENISFHKTTNTETQKSRGKKVLISKSEDMKNGNDLIDIRIHLIFLLILIVLIGINIPSMISWIKDFKYSRILDSDSSFSTSVISLICISCIWQMPLPIVNKTSTLQYYAYWIYNIWCILCCITYCQQNVFYLNNVISSIFLLTSAIQIFS